MSWHTVPEDRVTTEFVEATRMGAQIRTPLENITHFQFQDKYVTAFTKSNGEFVLKLSLHSVADTLKDVATQVHRSYLIMNHTLGQMKLLRPTGSSSMVLEHLQTVSVGGRLGIQSVIIPVSRRDTKLVQAAWEAAR